MKIIYIYSHEILDSALMKRKCLNGDEYDSQIVVMDSGLILWKGVCNVDSSNKTNKIEIANNHYYGIVGLHKNKYKAILLTNQYPSTADWTKLKEAERTLKTIQVNPKWNRKIAKYINVHKGGEEWDWSEGCITIHYRDYDYFINLFELNEIINIEKT